MATRSSALIPTRTRNSANGRPPRGVRRRWWRSHHRASRRDPRPGGPPASSRSLSVIAISDTGRRLTVCRLRSVPLPLAHFTPQDPRRRVRPPRPRPQPAPAQDGARPRVRGTHGPDGLGVRLNRGAGAGWTTPAHRGEGPPVRWSTRDPGRRPWSGPLSSKPAYRGNELSTPAGPRKRNTSLKRRFDSGQVERSYCPAKSSSGQLACPDQIRDCLGSTAPTATYFSSAVS